MKKLLLVMVFLCTIGTMMNANSSSKEIADTKEIKEYDGCASDCVRW